MINPCKRSIPELKQKDCELEGSLGSLDRLTFLPLLHRQARSELVNFAGRENLAVKDPRHGQVMEDKVGVLITAGCVLSVILGNPRTWEAEAGRSPTSLKAI